MEIELQTCHEHWYDHIAKLLEKGHEVMINIFWKQQV